MPEASRLAFGKRLAGQFATAFLFNLLGLASLSAAAERFDHRGSVGVLLGTGVDFKDSLPTGHFQRDQGTRLNLDLGGTMAVGVNGNEAKLWVRGSFGAPRKDWSAAVGYRGYFGEEQLKTFFDLDAVFHVTPFFVVGPRLGIGIQYEITSLWGVFAAAGGQIGAGAGLRVSFDAMVGFQLRSYLLE